MTRGLKYLTLLAILNCTADLSAQTDWERWGKAEISYRIPSPAVNAEKEEDNIVSGALSILKSIYSFFISDLDGDNCPFYPSCSSFYVQSVREEGLIKGTLMFADRFTRDMNFIKDPSGYPLHAAGKFFDPPGNYALKEDKIILSPSESRDKK